MANRKCAACGHRRNCINGLYCVTIGRYVEHSATPPCGDGKDTTGGVSVGASAASNTRMDAGGR